jgi:hypothetical protein
MRRPWQGKRRSLGVNGLRRRRSLVRPRSQSKAVGRVVKPAASPCRPLRTVFSDGIVRAVETVSPSFRSRRRGTPRSDRRSIPPRIGLHRGAANIVRVLWHAGSQVGLRSSSAQKGNCIAVSISEQTVSHAWMMFIWMRFISCNGLG